MLFNSIDFLIFFPIVIGILFMCPKKLRNLWLLVISYYFYMSWNPKYAILIVISTLITYTSGLLIETVKGKYSKQFVVAGSLITNLGILAVFKYANFALQSISIFFEHLGFGAIDRRIDLLLPVGISFYTFQALSYTIDVYRGQIKAEKSIVKYALFVSFFPQLVAGPIERSGNLLCQIREILEVDLWNFERIRDGILLMFWGLFQKLVIADRASILISHVYKNYKDFGFIELGIASILFAFQIYCDFGGYTNVARGAAQIMGFNLVQNFRQPYLALNIKDFWRRWHISLTSWFTDYIYIPLGGNRGGVIKKYINIFIVFTISGLWHGASWHFVIWGIIHAIYQIIGDIKLNLIKSIKKNKNTTFSFSQKLGKRLITFVLVDFAWIFFAADSLQHSYYIIQRMLSVFQTTGIYNIGLDKVNWFILFWGIILLFLVDIIHENGKSVFYWVNQQTIWFRWILYLGLIWCIILFGIYGVGYDANQFIYFQF